MEGVSEIKREKGRDPHVPREFVLILPNVRNTNCSVYKDDHERIIRTDSIKEISSRLNVILDKSKLLRKQHLKSSLFTSTEDPNPLASKILSPIDVLPQLNSYGNVTGTVKTSEHHYGAHKLTSTPPVDVSVANEVWWLDVTNPTWDDMRALGQVLSLHPLTIEDIFHQEQREKLESFSKLGYYFISFRAVQALKSSGGSQNLLSYHELEKHDALKHSTNDVYTEVINVYLVVFRQGICSFHFNNFSEHIDNVCRRTLRMEDTVRLSSDWVAHGILDSIVDSFFPILSGIEREINQIEALSIDSGPSETEKMDKISSSSSFSDEHTTLSGKRSHPNLSNIRPSIKDEKRQTEGLDKSVSSLKKENSQPTKWGVVPWNLNAAKRKLQIISFRSARTKGIRKVSLTSNETLLLRIANARRHVTSLGRHLSSKGEVMMQLRKRLIAIEADSIMSGFSFGKSAGEIAIYMGDIHDHIVTLQQSLNHYERMLDHLYPASLSQIRLSMAQAKGNTDKAILTLTVVSLMVLCIQVVVGLFSTNIKIPENVHMPGAPFNVFGIIVALAILIAMIVLAIVRYWYNLAKRKYTRRM